MGIHAQRRLQTATTGTISTVQLQRPSAGSTRYEISVTIRNGAGSLESPDNELLFMRVKLQDGTEFAGATRLYDAASGGLVLGDSSDSTNFPHSTGFWVEQDAFISTGRAQAFLEIASTDSEVPLIIEAGWIEQGVKNEAPAFITRIVDAADLDDVASNISDILTDTGITLPATLGTPVTSISADIATVDSNVDAILTDTADMQPKLGTPAGASISADIATIDTEVGAIQTDVTAILADTADMQPKLGTPAGASISADIATIDTEVGALQTDVTAILADTADMQPKIGTPAGASVSADIATVDANVDAILVDTGTTIPGELGTFSGQTNLQSLLAYLGELLDDANAPLGSVVGSDLFTSASSGAGSFTLTQVTGGRAPEATDDLYNNMYVVPLSGARAMELIQVTDYVGATKIISHGGATVGDGVPILLKWDQVGAPYDTEATAAGAVGNTVHSMLRKLDTDIAAVAAGSGTQRGQFEWYPYVSDEVLDADPSSATDAGTGSSEVTYRIINKFTLTLPEGTSASINSLAATLVWQSQGIVGTGTGTGDTKWMLSPFSASETIGNAPSGSAVDITDEVAGTTTLTTHRRSGTIRSTAIPATDGVHLLLVGKVDDASDTMNGVTFDETSVVVEYEV